MASKIYYGKPNGLTLNRMLSRYGMFEHEGKAVYNDVVTCIFIKDSTTPVTLINTPILSRNVVEEAIGQRIEDITDIRYSSTTLAIADGTFEGCTHLQSFIGTESNSLILIGSNAFKNCTSLKKIDVNLYNMFDVDSTAFEGCPIESIECKTTYDNLTPEDEEWASYIRSRIMGNDVEAPSQIKNYIVPFNEQLGLDVDLSAGCVQIKSFTLEEVYNNEKLREHLLADPYLKDTLDKIFLDMSTNSSMAFKTNNASLFAGPYPDKPDLTDRYANSTVSLIMGGLAMAGGVTGGNPKGFLAGAAMFGAATFGLLGGAAIGHMMQNISPGSGGTVPQQGGGTLRNSRLMASNMPSRQNQYVVYKLSASNDSCVAQVIGKIGRKDVSSFGTTINLS